MADGSVGTTKSTPFVAFFVHKYVDNTVLPLDITAQIYETSKGIWLILGTSVTKITLS